MLPRQARGADKNQLTKPTGRRKEGSLFSKIAVQKCYNELTNSKSWKRPWEEPTQMLTTISCYEQLFFFMYKSMVKLVLFKVIKVHHISDRWCHLGWTSAHLTDTHSIFCKWCWKILTCLIPKIFRFSRGVKIFLRIFHYRGLLYSAQNIVKKE